MKRILTAIFLLSVTLSAQTQHITSPTEAFGFQPGADRKLADWKELTAYFKKLSSESNRVRFEEVGKTTEGRPFVTVTISAAENLVKLEHYKQIQARLADPRETTAEDQRTDCRRQDSACCYLQHPLH